MKSLMLAMLLCVSWSRCVFAVDSDGDGQLDLIDVPGFSPSLSGFVSFEFKGVEDLGGVNLLTSATTLSLEENRLSEIQPGSFSGLHNLRTLLLDRNSITQIRAGAFEGLDTLGYLSLEVNPIEIFEDGAFRGLRNLGALLNRSNPVNDFAMLNLSGATFDKLSGCEGPRGLCVMTPSTKLVILDDAVLSQYSWQNMLKADFSVSLDEVSIVGLTFSDGLPATIVEQQFHPVTGIVIKNVRVDEALYAHYADELQAFAAKPGHSVIVAGDFDEDRRLTAADIDRLVEEIRAPSGQTARFDLTRDEAVDWFDYQKWVHGLKSTTFGDANLDREFNSTDLVQVFQYGQYEDGLPTNSGWASGDWQADGDFTSADLVVAFQDGGYEQGPSSTPVAVVPEPSGLTLCLLFLGGLWIRRNVR